MTPLEILEAHTVKRPWSEASRMRCKCGEVVTAETVPQLYTLHRAHLAEVLDKHMKEQCAEAKAEALNEVADEWERLMKIGKRLFTETTSNERAELNNWAGQEKPGWLRARANQYKEEQ